MSDESGFIKRIRLKNFLSYGEEGQTLECRPLNVFIGPNASGKSNLIEALRLLRAATDSDRTFDISGEIAKRDGVANWIWKGKTEEKIAHVQVYTESDPKLNLKFLIEYNIRFRKSTEEKFEIVEETLHRKTKFDEVHQTPKYDYVYFYDNWPILTYYEPFDSSKEPPSYDLPFNPDLLKQKTVEDLDLYQSVLSQRLEPERFPNITHLSKLFSKILIFKDWNLECNSPIRGKQKTDKYQDFLLEDGSNLSLVLNNLLEKDSSLQTIEKYIRKFYPAFQSFKFSTVDGVQVRVREQGLTEPVSAKRMSDGFLRYLCLLAILCHPKPPPVICIEEPELNMHPDILPTLAELLIDASKRTQLFVTTHSDILISAFTDTPENVVVCDRTAKGTNLKRLNREDLKDWLKDYNSTLGDLWLRGELGGVT